jgi:hypothetical protein
VEIRNTKYFHKVATVKRNNKHLWEIWDELGQEHRGQEALKYEANMYFQNLFSKDTQITPVEQLNIVHMFPLFITEEDSDNLEHPVTKKEIMEILKLFAVDKSSGPDGWTVEFYLKFFEVVSDDLVDLVEDTRSRGRIKSTLNSTFLALIPKENNPQTFGDYRPITLCNLCYKLISKVIANMIKPILSRELSGEQLRFLKGRQILDAIGTAHELIHSIRARKQKALILKMDLQKAYDCFNWDFLLLILVQTGFNVL